MSGGTLGLAGGFGGKEFTGYTLPAGAKVKEVHVFAERFVDAVQLYYLNEEGELEALPKIGGLGGTPHVFTLDDDEYITGISGCTGWYVDNIRIHTNKRTSESYGGQGGYNDFYYGTPEGAEIAGLFGRADWYLDALGIITRPLPSTPKSEEQAAEPAEEVDASTEPDGRVPKPKDLQKVKGIGPKMAAILVKHGIFDLNDLSKVKVETLNKMLDKAGTRYALVDPSSWPEQAASAATGD